MDISWRRKFCLFYGMRDYKKRNILVYLSVLIAFVFHKFIEFDGVLFL